MGLAGGLLTAIRSVAHSRTTDPVAGQRRPVSSTPSSASLSARQDLGQGSWGAMLTGGLESTFSGVRPVARMGGDPRASVYGAGPPAGPRDLRASGGHGG